MIHPPFAAFDQLEAAPYAVDEQLPGACNAWNVDGHFMSVSTGNGMFHGDDQESEIAVVLEPMLFLSSNLLQFYSGPWWFLTFFFLPNG